MTLSLIDWHTRFTQQAHWTQDLRNYIYGQIAIKNVKNILDVGCGTGVLEDELVKQTTANIFGLDINPEYIAFAIKHTSTISYAFGDAHNLPYSSGAFDITLCHFLLLWVQNPQQVIQEMVRITTPGGSVIALAEPDYGGRIDYPSELAQLGRWQRDALQMQSANPLMGRELRALFNRAGLLEVEVGVLGGQWKNYTDTEDLETEWQVLQSDLLQNSDFLISEKDLKNRDAAARETGQRILFVPTFYAWGRVKG
jgi:ubiquinone/menaquinone biosynthesis C-methylase UbiE